MVYVRNYEIKGVGFRRLFFIFEYKNKDEKRKQAVAIYFYFNGKLCL